MWELFFAKDVWIICPRYRWIKNGKHFDWQTYDNRISQQPGRGTLVVTVPQDEDRGEFYQKLDSSA